MAAIAYRLKQRQLLDKDSLKLCQEDWSMESDELVKHFEWTLINIIERENYQELFDEIINKLNFQIRLGEYDVIQGDDWDAVRLIWGGRWEYEAVFDRNKYVETLGELVNFKKDNPHFVKCLYDIDDEESYRQQQSEKIEYFIARIVEYSQGNFEIVTEKYCFGINYIDDDLLEKMLEPVLYSAEYTENFRTFLLSDPPDDKIFEYKLHVVKLVDGVLEITDRE